jgi:plastocyanin
VQSFSFAPRPIHLRAGQPVTLTFVNRSGGGHDFTAKKFFASSRIVAGAAPDGEIELSGHQTRSITLVPRAGTYKAHCGHFMHKQMGMTDLIIVG